MMTVMADVRRGDSCGVASNKRIKIGCGGGGGGGSTKEKKDKFGERVAALQQLVSPFGKTDTASVLQEAAAYIKFLHEQLEVLSAPYIWTPPAGTALPGSEKCCSSLRSHGLCLVPAAYTSGIVTSSSNGADIWAPVGADRS